jgi:hypothetical protein
VSRVERFIGRLRREDNLEKKFLRFYSCIRTVLCSSTKTS